MRILIIGNDPREIGGVANYTRPLAAEFSKIGHNVSYFFSGSWHRKYNWLIRPYLRIDRKEFPFEFAELINAPIWATYHGDTLPEISNRLTELLFRRYVEARKPDVLHIHSRLALPISIIEIASKMGIPVFNTIHVYGLICPKRVMIDREGHPCSGPSDLTKCAACAEPVNVRKLKFLARIENTDRRLLDTLVLMKKKVARLAKKEMGGSSGCAQISEENKANIQEGLIKRLEHAVNLMNHHVAMNICVSSDVKTTMMRYGVKENHLLVQHIGSVLATRQKREMHELHNPLVLGNIGGVWHYKGTHVLLDAISKIKDRRFVLKVFGKFEAGYVDRIMRGKEDLAVEFFGAYRPEELPNILDQIDIMVLPSICKDTAPQTIFESYSAGIPIVASAIGGFPDFIKDGVNGRLFRSGDSQALADILVTILDHPEKLVAFSRNIPRLKTLEENVQELLLLYKSRSERGQ